MRNGPLDFVGVHSAKCIGPDAFGDALDPGFAL